MNKMHIILLFVIGGLGLLTIILLSHFQGPDEPDAPGTPDGLPPLEQPTGLSLRRGCMDRTLSYSFALCRTQDGKVLLDSECFDENQAQQTLTGREVPAGAFDTLVQLLADHAVPDQVTAPAPAPSAQVLDGDVLTLSLTWGEQTVTADFGDAQGERSAAFRPAEAALEAFFRGLTAEALQ